MAARIVDSAIHSAQVLLAKMFISSENCLEAHVIITKRNDHIPYPFSDWIMVTLKTKNPVVDTKKP